MTREGTHTDWGKSLDWSRLPSGRDLESDLEEGSYNVDGPSGDS